MLNATRPNNIIPFPIQRRMAAIDAVDESAIDKDGLVQHHWNGPNIDARPMAGPAEEHVCSDDLLKKLRITAAHAPRADLTDLHHAISLSIVALDEHPRRWSDTMATIIMEAETILVTIDQPGDARRAAHRAAELAAMLAHRLEAHRARLMTAALADALDADDDAEGEVA